MVDSDEKPDLEEDRFSPLVEKPKTDDEKFDEMIEQGFSPDEIADMEERAVSGASDDQALKPKVEVDENDAVNQRIQDFYKEDESKTPIKARGFAKGGKMRKRAAIVAAVGLPALLAGIAFLPGLLGIFKMQNFFENTSATAFLRMNASFDNRSDKWIKSYIRLRLTEVDGEVSGKKDSLFFRAGKVDTNNPIIDWYQTMRASKFEDDLLEKEGISFQSAITKDEQGRVTFGFAQIKIKDQNIDFNLSDGGSGIDLTDRAKLGEALNRVDVDMSGIIDTDIISGPGSNKKARRIIKDAVDRNTKSWQVFHRRKVRKAIQNMTGVSSWRLFETTRDKYDAKKKDLFDRIMSAVLPNNRTGRFVNCLFGAGDCPSATDPASSDSRNGLTAGDGSREGRDNEATDQLDENGNNIPQTDEDGAVVRDANGNIVNTPSGDYTPEGAASEVVGDVTSVQTKEAAEDAAGKSAKKIFMKEFISKVLGNPATKVWSWLKKIAKFHDVLENNKLGKLVIQGRRAQYMAAFASMAIAVSQMKSGDISGTEDTVALGDESGGLGSFAQTVTNSVGLSRDGEVNQYLSYFDNAERSEAWVLYNRGELKGTVSALAENDPGREAYCDMVDAEKKQQPVQYRCPDDEISAGKLGEFSKSYSSTVGKLLGPIADAVNAVKNSLLGRVLNVVDSVASKVVDPVIEKVLSATGLDKKIEDVVGYGVTKALEYAGAGVKYEPTSPGQLNYMLMGAAATAEASARGNGAALTSSLAGLKDYSNQMALDWKSEKDASLGTWDRYASLSNPKSLASSSLMAISTSTPKSLLNSATNPVESFDNYANALGGKVFAAVENDSHGAAEWSGLDTYDFPKECIDLDPLDPNYLKKVSNAPEGVPRTYEVLGDSNVFWDAVYSEFSGSTDEKEAKAAGVYNCFLLDRSVQGGLGYVYGYTNDGGYENSTGTPGSFGAGVANLNCEGYKRFDSEPAILNNGIPAGEFTVPYSAAEKTLCQTLKNECTTGVGGIKKGLCAALEYDGVYYGSSAKPEKNLQFNGFYAKTNALHNPVTWTQERKPGLNPYNVLECSALTTIAVYRAFGYSSAIGCSGRWSAANHPDLLMSVSETDVQPGDFLTTTNECAVGGDASSHIAVAASAPDSSGNLIIYESSAWQTTTHFREVNMSYFSGGHKSRWIGPGL